MFGGGSSSSSGGRGRDTTRIHHLRQVTAGGSTGYTPQPDQQQQQNHLMNMNMLLQQHHQQQSLLPHMSPYQHQQLLSPSAGSVGGGGGGFDDDFPKRDERILQWGRQETSDLIAIRSELEAEFRVMAAKRNNNKGQGGLWEAVVAKMKHLGYSRTSHQCKCKWKNLLFRYNKEKEKEVCDSGNGQQFPFYEEMHELFMRSNHMTRLVNDLEAGAGGSVQSGKKRVRKPNADDSSGEFIDNHEDDNEEEKVLKDSIVKNKKIPKGNRIAATDVSNKGSSSTLTAIQEILQSFFRQQLQIDAQWRATTENSAQERNLFELDWRQMKEKLERERMMQEQEWREREQQRKEREETRAEKRDALLAILLKKMIAE